MVSNRNSEGKVNEGGHGTAPFNDKAPVKDVPQWVQDEPERTAQAWFMGGPNNSDQQKSRNAYAASKSEDADLEAAGPESFAPLIRTANDTVMGTFNIQLLRSDVEPSYQKPRRARSLKKNQICGHATVRRQSQTGTNLKQLPLLNQPDLPEETHALQIQVNLSGKTTMQWVRATDLVQDLLQKLESRLGIPSSYLRLLYKEEEKDLKRKISRPPENCKV